jgi:hypothetical protein
MGGVGCFCVSDSIEIITRTLTGIDWFSDFMLVPPSLSIHRWKVFVALDDFNELEGIVIGSYTRCGKLWFFHQFDSLTLLNTNESLCFIETIPSVPADMLLSTRNKQSDLFVARSVAARNLESTTILWQIDREQTLYISPVIKCNKHRVFIAFATYFISHRHKREVSQISAFVSIEFA